MVARTAVPVYANQELAHCCPLVTANQLAYGVLLDSRRGPNVGYVAICREQSFSVYGTKASG